MTLEGPEWMVWRDAPGFNQRLRARFDDPDVLRRAWGCRTTAGTGSTDFDLTYTRVRRPQ
jgi:hypothetical protein